MLIPLSWVREYAPVDEEAAQPGEVARRLTAAGLEVESAEPAGHDVRGVAVAEVLEIEELTGFRRPVRFVRLTTGGAGPGPGAGEGGPGAGPHGVICGA